MLEGSSHQKPTVTRLVPNSCATFFLLGWYFFFLLDFVGSVIVQSQRVARAIWLQCPAPKDLLRAQRRPRSLYTT